ncbi:MAG TPA: heme-binding domain-containing protein [Puia sp.]|jgi:hypothetical protein|nr:heme-binding domain-containing protein [Puia sp.]
MIRTVLLVVLVLFIAIQFFRPSKNNSGDTHKSITQLYEVPPNVDAILQRSCRDCHSNKTNYPWYDEIQPVAWWVNGHIGNGKRHLNFDTYSAQRIAIQKKRMEDCLEQLKNDEMPLSSYTLIHRNAILTQADKDTLSGWCQGIIDQIKAKYPPDSLVLPKRKKP